MFLYLGESNEVEREERRVGEVDSTIGSSIDLKQFKKIGYGLFSSGSRIHSVHGKLIFFYCNNRILVRVSSSGVKYLGKPPHLRSFQISKWTPND